MKKNTVIIGLAGVALAASLTLGCGAAPQTETPEVATPTAPKTQEVDYLFVHSAEAATLADGVLRLGGVNPATLFFSDRPERITGHLTTEDFVAKWGEGDDSFASNPPNATLSILTGPEPQEIVVVLTEPRLEDGDLLYNVEVTEGADTAEGGASSVFIDIIGRPLTPVSYAGCARRVTRRAVLY